MAGKIRSISNPRLSLNILSQDDIQRIHTATLDILQSTDVRFPSLNALDVWEANGAVVDRNTSVVKIPSTVIEAALIGAEAGFPVGFMTMASCGSTAPATFAGNLVVGPEPLES